MKTMIMSIFTRTPLHVGAGNSVGAIDQPVIRERHTGFPVIPGSAVKGVLRDYTANDNALKAIEEELFGHEATDKNDDNRAGQFGFGEAKLLAFPLRSAKGSFAMATCPLALSRYARDRGLTFAIPAVKDEECLAAAGVLLGDQVALEEYVFKSVGAFPADWADHLSDLLADVVLKEAKTHLVLISDGDFSHFAINACQVQYHNRIGENGTVVDRQLFNTETVPSETLFYAPVHVIRSKYDDNLLFQHFAQERLLQFGGDCTTGLGFSTVKLV